MAIFFVPQKGQVLLCNYDQARVHPEMAKPRRAVVVSVRTYNVRHGGGAGRCIVVPFSVQPPVNPGPAIVAFPGSVYANLTLPTWAYCDTAQCVSHDRLDRVRVRGRNLSESLSIVDIARIEDGLRHALGIEN
jgi:uncharacterized protein YifN (PemK superfamily)